jgi:hypothetical protein
MKSIFLSPSAISTKIVIAVASMLILLSSCSKKIMFENSTVVPAARGSVTVKEDGNKNYRIGVSLSNLAEPDRLQPSKKTYVVWMESKENPTRNIGQINTSGSFLSSKLRSSFETVSSDRPTKIFLTAEDDGSIQYPSSLVILTTNNF